MMTQKASQKQAKYEFFVQFDIQTHEISYSKHGYTTHQKTPFHNEAYCRKERWPNREVTSVKHHFVKNLECIFSWFFRHQFSPLFISVFPITDNLGFKLWDKILKVSVKVLPTFCMNLNSSHFRRKPNFFIVFFYSSRYTTFFDLAPDEKQKKC